MRNKPKWYSILLVGLVSLLTSLVVGCQALPLIVDFSATPSEISSGESAILSWNVTQPTSVSIDQGIGNVSAVGTQTVSPLTTTAYTLTASNAAGNVTWFVVITVTPTSAPAAPEDVIPLAVPGFDFVEKSDRVEPIFEGEDYSAYSFFKPASSSKFHGKVHSLVIEVHKFKDEASAGKLASVYGEGGTTIQVDSREATLVYDEDFGETALSWQQGRLVVLVDAIPPFEATTFDQQTLTDAVIEGAVVITITPTSPSPPSGGTTPPPEESEPPPMHLSASFTVTNWEQDYYEFSEEWGDYVYVYYEVENTGVVDIDYYEVYFVANCWGGSYHDWTNGMNVRVGAKLSGSAMIDVAGKEVINVEVEDWELTTYW